MQELPLNHPILIITTRIHGTPPTHISIHAMMFLLTHLHPHDPLCLSVCLPACLSVCMSVCLPACLFSQGHVIPSYPPSPSRSPLPVCLPVISGPRVWLGVGSRRRRTRCPKTMGPVVTNMLSISRQKITLNHPS